MHTPSDKSQQPQSQSIANELSEKKSSGGTANQFADNRPEAVAQRKLQEMANNSAQVRQLKGYQEMADNSSLTNNIVQLSGSHGKTKYFKISTVYITNWKTQAERSVGVNYIENLGIVLSHDNEPANKSLKYARSVIRKQNLVTLGQYEGISKIDFDHYTAK